jgi:hypothetical protein
MTEPASLDAPVDVRVDVVDLDGSGYRQIAPRERLTVELANRRAEIESAVALASDIVQASAAKVSAGGGWGIQEIEAKFGITLTAEAGVILSKATAEATFEVTIKISKQTNG